MFKILITDDDVDLRELLTEAVSNWGYVVSVAKDGEEALKKLRMERFDIVITDLMMPGMDGLKLLERIVELDKDILVIIVTGYATIETAVKAIETGAYDYIAKPFRLDELMIVLKNACEKLKLLMQNKKLLEELRGAYAEIESLKKALEKRSGSNGSKEEEEGGISSDGVDGKGSAISTSNGPRETKEFVSSNRQQGYLKEADRFILTTKPSLKA